MENCTKDFHIFMCIEHTHKRGSSLLIEFFVFSQNEKKNHFTYQTARQQNYVMAKCANIALVSLFLFYLFMCVMLFSIDTHYQN